MRRVGIVTGNRADYGHLLPVMRRIQAEPRLDLRVFVTGMHLSREFGTTGSEIARDGFRPEAVLPVRGYGDSPGGTARGVGRMVQDLAKAFSSARLDLVMLMGDRGEMLAAAVAATYLGIPIVHLHGGERTGHVDEPVRHAITRLAHVHLAATPGSARRLRRMGEDPWRIHVVGAPRLDAIVGRRFPPRARVLRSEGLDPSKPLILVVQHPTAKDRSVAGALYGRTLRAVATFPASLVAIYPNGDPGSREMIRVLRAFARHHPMVVHRSLPEDEFLDLLSAASVLVGNSSSGIIEAPSMGIPVVNVGDRQARRERAGNVLDVPYDEARIRAAVARALRDKRFRRRAASRRSPWGDGRAAARIVGILKSVPLDSRLLDKRLTW